MTPTPTSLEVIGPTLGGPPRPFMLRGLAEKEVRADVVDAGTGTPVVFLHGLVGLNDHWETVAHRVVARNRCIMLQLPLLGLTGDDCSIHGATELTARFLQQYVGGPSVIVGNSFGGHVALRLAVAHMLGGSGLWQVKQEPRTAMSGEIAAVAEAQASTAVAREIAKSPILRRSETKRTSGITANGNCIDSTTWLNTRSCAVPRSP